MIRLNVFIVFFLSTLSNLSFSRTNIIGGKITTEKEGKGIFQLTIDPTKYSYCTATKVAKNFILTSAHCFNKNQNPSQIGINERVNNQFNKFNIYKVKRTHIHPSYLKSPGDFETYDVALVELRANKSFDKIGTNQISFDVTPDGVTVEYWGYGCQKSMLRPHEGYPIRKKSLNTTLGRVALERNLGGQDSLVRRYKNHIYKNNLLTPGIEFDGKSSSICFGDSGGPVFYKGKVVGINSTFTSRYIKNDGYPGSDATDLNIHLRLSIVKDWVNTTIVTGKE